VAFVSSTTLPRSTIMIFSLRSRARISGAIGPARRRAWSLAPNHTVRPRVSQCVTLRRERMALAPVDWRRGGHTSAAADGQYDATLCRQRVPSIRHLELARHIC
jgi:hypothetical protein